jgi:hypothetical protein
MNPSDVIESYVVDVMRRVGVRDRNDIGLELRGLLTELLADKADAAERPADDEMVLAILRSFGTPAEVAARYDPSGMVIIPAAQTRPFVILSIAGVAFQWALTLPAVFKGMSLAGWWLSWGLGSLWWPGFLVMIALVTTLVRQNLLSPEPWRPRSVDPERVNRKALGFGLLCMAFGAAIMILLPWSTAQLRDPMPAIFAFDPGFLHSRAAPVLLLWLASVTLLATVRHQGRWSSFTRRLDMICNLAWASLLSWWLAAGAIFRAKPTDDVTKACLCVILISIVLIIGYNLYRGRTRLRAPKVAR